MFNWLEHSLLFICIILLLIAIFLLFVFSIIIHLCNCLDLTTISMLFHDHVDGRPINNISIFHVRNSNLNTVVFRLVFSLDKSGNFSVAVVFSIYSIKHQYTAQTIYPTLINLHWKYYWLY